MCHRVCFFVFLSLVPVLGTLHNNLHNHFCGAGSVLHTVSQSTTTTWSTIKISIWYVWINTNTAAFFPRDKLCVSWNQILSVHTLPACLGNPETRCRLALWVWPFSTLLLLVYYLQFFHLFPYPNYVFFYSQKWNGYELGKETFLKVLFSATLRLLPP